MDLVADGSERALVRAGAALVRGAAGAAREALGFSFRPGSPGPA
jgi:hypothetical protein